MTVWNIEEIEKVLAMIEVAIQYREDNHNPEALAEKITELINLYPASSEALASITYLKENQRRIEYDNVVKAIKSSQIGKEMAGVTSASNLSKYIDSRIANYLYYEKKAERLNRAITHAIEGYRSILSHEKEAMRMAGYSS
jgi:hypothetical protein